MEKIIQAEGAANTKTQTGYKLLGSRQEASEVELIGPKKNKMK